jgi:hypothetical protein
LAARNLDRSKGSLGESRERSRQTGRSAGRSEATRLQPLVQGGLGSGPRLIEISDVGGDCAEAWRARLRGCGSCDRPVRGGSRQVAAGRRDRHNRGNPQGEDYDPDDDKRARGRQLSYRGPPDHRARIAFY